MASLLLGATEEFDPTTEKTLDQFLFANKIGSYLAVSSEAVFAAAEKKKSGRYIYDFCDRQEDFVILDLCFPVNPKDKTFEELCELQHHFKRKRSEVAESY